MNLPNYIGVYVWCPLEGCARRDPKGLYAKAQSSEIAYCHGGLRPHQVPENPKIILDTDSATVEECVELVLANGRFLGYIS